MKKEISQFLTKQQLKEIALTYGRTKGATELAKEMGVSKQRIQQIATRFRKLGVDIPSMKVRQEVYSEIIDELKKENPEIIK